MKTKLKSAIIMDLDGVLVRGEHRDKYAEQIANGDYSWFANMVAHFQPYQWAVELVKAMAVEHKILFLTARSERFRHDTVTWLDHYVGIKSYKLLMRPEDSPHDAPDAEVKKGIYYDKVFGRYNVLFAIDDRKENIDLYRSLGITALHNTED